MRFILGNLLMAALITMSLACCVQGDTTDPVVKTAFSVVQSGQFSGITTGRLEAIRNEEDFAELWEAHGQGFSPVPGQPAIDFGQNMVLAAFLGERSTGGFTIAVTEVEERTDSLLVNVKVTIPGTNCTVPQAISQPFQIVTIPQSEKLVAFSTEVEKTNCP